MNRLRHILSVLLVCLLICSMSVTAFATGEQGGNTTLTANVPAAVTYDANGGSGTMEADSVAVGGELTLPQCGFTAPSGKKFKCWKIGTKEYDPGEKITVNSDVTITAVWKNKTSGGSSGLDYVPKTGDSSGILLWTALGLMSAMALAGVEIYRKRRVR